MDHDVEVGCGVEENNVGGGSRHWRQRAGKSRDSRLKSNGIESMSICCLRRVSAAFHGTNRKVSGRAHFAALHELTISRSASSAALAVSRAS